ncbi:glutathione S-transferase L3 isoform X1 [Beta vulgaris subsp. vulgaris]|uniref:glutathione S-transferase L3 isoform X1 n=1 Tax=Beta vulgaris subsp. vulgaris TaxID=3555 RepID=UPI002037478E|nr:glutathione S-transferase L3 isoform X1 [Beta vulgaris subsp. vulgaris]
MATSGLIFVSPSTSQFLSSQSHYSITSILPLNPMKSNTLSILPLPQHPHFLSLHLKIQRKAIITAANIASTGKLEDDLPPPLDSTSDPPPIFDGTPRLYISYTCPYAQRVWITRNCKGLQDKIKLVPIDLLNRPSWYKQKVYPPNKVPSLEYNNEVRGESLDLIKFIDSHFEGPSLFPSDSAKQDFAGVLFSYAGSFHKAATASFKEEKINAETGVAFDYIEEALSKFNDGPFFLGQFSLVDIAYVPFFERYVPFLLDVKKYDLTAGRPKIAAWLQEMNKVTGYKQTKTDPKLLVESYKKRFLTSNTSD